MAENDIYRVRTPRNRTYLGNRDSHAYFTNELAYSNFLCKEITESTEITDDMLIF